MKKTYLLLLLSGLTFLAYAQEHQMPLWTDGIPNYQATDEKEIVDGKSSRRISYVQEPAIEVFLPSKDIATGKAVVICPGGGYSFLAYDKEGTDVAKWLNGNGIAGIVLKYRLPKSKGNIEPHKTPLMDAQQAMKLVRKNAEGWNIDPEKIGIMGFSAGGHLASTLGTHFDAENRPAFMILIYPVITMKDPLTHRGSRNNLLGGSPGKDMVEYYSNETQVKKTTPPTFIIHSMDDKVVPVENSLNFYQSLKDANVPAEMHLYPYGGHGYALAINKGRLSTWKYRLLEWLDGLNEDIK